MQIGLSLRLRDQEMWEYVLSLKCGFVRIDPGRYNWLRY